MLVQGLVELRIVGLGLHIAEGILYDLGFALLDILKGLFQATGLNEKIDQTLVDIDLLIQD